ncbi:MAG: YfhO family protein [Prevotellaceae bacterium]|nr:YfhO family protein [Prevotellaceae bacterium]
MKTKFKQILPYVTAIVIFFAVSVGYFTPAIFEGKALYQTDIRKGAGMGRDLSEHAKENNNEKSLWTSRMFSGMPTYQISTAHKSSLILRDVRDAFEGWLPAPANYLFAYMLGFFILLLALRVNPWVAIIGAIAYGFSSYFLIIIEAGHIWKVSVLELIPPTIAGIIWAYRGKFLLGGAVAALFFMLQLFSNHIQMTYYSLMFVGIFVVCRFIYDIRKKQLSKFFKASAVLIVAGMISVGANSTNILLSAKYAEQTIRGKSELTDNAGNKTSGLDRDYVTQWSYGIGETFTLLIPNTKGGATEPIGYSMRNGQWQRDNNKNKSALNQTNTPQIREYAAQQTSYWGSQPFTSGPVYVGAFILFLFVFGIFIVKGYIKWALLAGTIFSVLLAWGHNFMGLTDLFLDYFPMYNKFRAVSSILVVAELTIPILAILSLAQIIENKRLIVEKKKQFFISLGLTGGFALLFILLPRLFFNFSSSSDFDALKSQNLSQPMMISIVDDLENVRISIFRSDAWRSVIIILIGVGLLWLYSSKKIKKSLLITAIAALTLFDLANVDKRYLNNGNFLPKSATKTAWEMTAADKEILTDSDPNYRVFSLAVSPFNDASVSYYHKSVGGYHAAKLRRYQELIDKYLNSVNINILSMLNMKYIITPNRNSGQLTVEQNPDAKGAWAVDSICIVNNADEEMAALGKVDLKNTAVVDKRFENQLKDFVPQTDDTVSIELADYKINDLKYKINSNSEQVIVFSEIYYNDGLTFWEAFIDGQPVPHFRANYVLRAVRVPAGEHLVEFVFKPKIYNKLEAISLICMWIIIASILFVFCMILKDIKVIKFLKDNRFKK